MVVNYHDMFGKLANACTERSLTSKELQMLDKLSQWDKQDDVSYIVDCPICLSTLSIDNVDEGINTILCPECNAKFDVVFDEGAEILYNM